MCSSDLPYCDHYIILNPRVEGDFKPNRIIPFKYGKEKIKELIRTKFKESIFAPADFLSEVKLNGMTGEYVPFWMYNYDTNYTYAGQGTVVRCWTDGDTEYTEKSLYKITRDLDIDYRDVPVDASIKMPDNIMDLLEPYNYNELETFKPEYMSGYLEEKYNMNWNVIEGRAKQKMGSSAQNLVNDTISGYDTVSKKSDNLKVIKAEHNYDLLPVWKYIYTYKDQTYPFFINGQTGKVIGKVPVSKVKVLVYGITLWLSVFGILGLGSYLATNLIYM